MPSHGERLTTEAMTFLMTDVVRSTALWEEDFARAAQLTELLDGIAADVAVTESGELLKSRGEGDSHFYAFRSPAACVRAAVKLQRRVAELGDAKFSVRAAIHTGEVQHRDNDYYGPVINRCARIRELAGGGQILVSASTEAVVSNLDDEIDLVPLGEHRLRDLARPERLYWVKAPHLQERFEAIRSLTQYPHNLPIQLTTFVGRRAELASLTTLVRSHRLVTITGAGGSGKTRLALQAAAQLLEAYSDGVWFVDLSITDSPDAIAPIACAAIGIKPEDDAAGNLFRHLGNDRHLVILDNCEHMHGPCLRFATELLVRCAQTSVLATSREAFAVQDEHRFRCPGLDVAGEHDPQAVLRSDAVQLLIDRCRWRGIDLPADPESLAEIATLCRRLDGLPLAIELVAGGLQVMSVAELGRQLTEFLMTTKGAPSSPSRQMTMVAAMHWSISLLSPRASELLRRLAFFPNGWTLDAAVAVCAYGTVKRSDVREELAKLVNHSLIFSEHVRKDHARMRMLQTTREVLGFRRSMPAPLRARFLDYFASIATTADERMAEQDSSILDSVDADYENISACLLMAYIAADPRYPDLAMGLRRYWMLTGKYREAISWLTRAAAQLPAASSWRGQALNALGAFYIRVGETSQAKAVIDEAQELLAPEMGAPWARCLMNLAIVDGLLGHHQEALNGYARCEREYLRLESPNLRAHALLNQGVLLLDLGRITDETLRTFADAAESAERAGELSLAAVAHSDAGEVHLLLGRHREAAEQMVLAYEIWQSFTDLYEIAGSLYDLALLFGQRALWPTAAFCLEAGDALSKENALTFSERQAKIHASVRALLSHRDSDHRVAKRMVRSKALPEVVSIVLAALRDLLADWPAESA